MIGMGKEGQHPKAFVNILLFLLITGILLGRCFAYKAMNYGLWCGVLVFLCLMAMGLIYQKNQWSWGVIATMVLLLGWGRYSGAMMVGPLDVENWVGQEITVTGEVAGAPIIRLDNEGKRHIKYVVNCHGLTAGGEHTLTYGKIALYAKDNSYDDHKGHLSEAEGDEAFGRSGDNIKVSGKLMKLHDYQNPGRMDMIMSQRAQGIHGQMTAGKYSIELSPQDKDMLGRVAARIRTLYKNQMEAVMPKEDSNAIFAMLFGGYGGIKPELLEAFTVTGLIHILSVSGSHVTLMAGTANVLGKVLGLSGGLTAVLGTFIIGIYSLLADFTTPVIRSALMGILTILALTMGREKDARHILSITAFGILLAWPLSLFDISFQLSFGATAGLLYLSPKIRKQLGGKMPRFIAGSLAVTMGAQLAVLPFLAWYFNVVSISSLLANILVEPIVEMIIVISLMAGIVVGLVPVVGKLIFIGASLMLGAAYELSRAIARLPAGQVYVPTMNYGFWTLYYGVLGVLIIPFEKRQKLWKQIKEHVPNNGKERYIITGIILLIVLGIFYARYPREMQVHFIDVGQGDAALVVTPHGHAFMIDTGGTRQGAYDIGTRVDVPYLLHYGVRKLDFIMLTHAHEDHAGGVGGILRKIPVGTVLIGHEGAANYSRTFGDSLVVRRENMSILQEGTEMILDGVRIQILYAPAENTTGSNTGNEFSNLIRVSYGQHSFLFTGDLSKEHEAVLTQRGTPLTSTVLKVGHHGSDTSSSEEFLRAVNPKWSVISVGYGNSFGHPKQEIINRLHRCTGSEILRTDEHGAIVFATDGEKLRVNTQIVYDNQR